MGTNVYFESPRVSKLQLHSFQKLLGLQDPQSNNREK